MVVAAIAFFAALTSFFEIFRAFKISLAVAGFAMCFFISPPTFSGAVLSFLSEERRARLTR